MGYTTDFEGSFKFNKQLSEKMQQYLTKFSETRRVKRRQDKVFGIDGEFFVFGTGDYGQGIDADIIDYNTPPKTQPSLWCQWTPTHDGMGLEWDGGEKFYSYHEWLFYLVHKVLAPNGYVLNGTVKWRGEEHSDVGEIYVENNQISVNGELMESVSKSETDYKTWKRTETKDYMKLDTVLLLDNVERLLTEKVERETEKVETEVPITKETVDAACDAAKAGLITTEELVEMTKKFIENLVD